MDRRAFLATVGGGLLAAPVAAEGQQTGKVYRIGNLTPTPAHNPLDDAFEQALRELGYVEGQNLRFERRFLAGRTD